MNCFVVNNASVRDIRDNSNWLLFSQRILFFFGAKLLYKLLLSGKKDRPDRNTDIQSDRQKWKLTDKLFFTDILTDRQKGRKTTDRDTAWQKD